MQIDKGVKYAIYVATLSVVIIAVASCICAVHSANETVSDYKTRSVMVEELSKNGGRIYYELCDKEQWMDIGTRTTISGEITTTTVTSVLGYDDNGILIGIETHETGEKDTSSKQYILFGHISSILIYGAE